MSKLTKKDIGAIIITSWMALLVVGYILFIILLWDQGGWKVLAIMGSIFFLVGIPTIGVVLLVGSDE